MQICQVIKMMRNKNGNLRHKTAANMPLTSLRLVMEIKLKIMPLNSVKRTPIEQEEVCKWVLLGAPVSVSWSVYATWGNYGLINPT